MTIWDAQARLRLAHSRIATLERDLLTAGHDLATALQDKAVLTERLNEAHEEIRRLQDRPLTDAGRLAHDLRLKDDIIAALEERYRSAITEVEHLHATHGACIRREQREAV